MFALSCARIRQRLLLPIVIVSCCAPGLLADTDLRLHIAWGGGVERQWGGRVMLVDGGTMRDLSLLGMDADEPGTITQRGQQLLISQRRTRNYDGLEISVTAPLTSKLRVELLAAGERTARVVEVPLEELVSGYRSESLDSDKNRLVIRRSPGDFVRLRFQRDHLVFTPNEAFMLDVVPHELRVSPGSSVRCVMRLYAARSREMIWEQAQTLRADARGKLSAWERCLAKIPDGEGVYDLRISLSNRRLTSPLSGDKPIAKRQLQLVVVASGTQAVTEEEPRRLVLDLDPTQKNWWERLTRLPQWTLLPGLRSEGSLGNVKASRITRDGRTWTSLPKSSWQAYPLPIDEVGAEHELEIDFPGNHPQSFVVSIVEPNPAGKVIPVGLDSGVHISREDVAGVAVKPKLVNQHRLTFWPKTKSPMVLVTNLRDDQSAIFGHLRVHRRALGAVDQQVVQDGRYAFAYFERPLFPECFGATEGLDPETGRSLEDWKTFFDGGQRMVRHVKRSGYNGLVMTCVSEGSSLYPSRLLQPTPKHDRGVFFASGQDAVRKDVLEMLFRICDREGVQLVPAVEFATPLPVLEELRWRAQDKNPGIDLVDENGMSWIETYGSKRGKAPYYNPLNQEVQSAMLAVVREIAARYSNHPSFGGVSITMTPEGYTQFPDANWGLDPHNLEEFRKQAGGDVPVNSSIRKTVDDAAIREKWLEYRAGRLTKLYQQMSTELQRYRPQSRLYLAGGRLVESKPVQRAFRPALPRQASVNRAMQELGLDAQALTSSPSIVLLRPELFAWNSPESQVGADIEFNQSEEVDEYFKTSVPGTHFLHDPYRARLPSFDEVSPFGRRNTLVSLVAQISSVGDANRQRFIRSLATRDARVIFEGGWMLPLGQEESVNRFLSVFQRLPDEPFEDVVFESQKIQPLRIRRLEKNSETYLYLINESPWQVGAALSFRSRRSVRFEAIGRPRVEAVKQEGDQIDWNLTLSPFDIVAVKADAILTVENAVVSLPPDVMPGLKDRVEDLVSRAAHLRDPPSLQLLENPGFESDVTAAGEIPGWSISSNHFAVQVDAENAFDGERMLSVSTTEKTRMILSDPIDPPESGRLSVAIRAKVSDVKQQPQIRLVLRANDQTYYPWAPIGAHHANRSLNGEWKQFVFRVSHLPPIGKKLKIGIEVSGEGVVMIDDIQLFDILALDDREVKVLANLVTFMDYLRENGMVSDCLRRLDGYWPQYLLNNVPPHVQELAERPLRELPTEIPVESPKTWDRVKRFVPKWNRF